VTNVSCTNLTTGESRCAALVSRGGSHSGNQDLILIFLHERAFLKKPFPRRRMESNKQYHRSKKILADRGGKICATTVHPTNAMICFRKNRLFKQADSTPKGRILQLSTLDSRLSCTNSTSVKLSFFALRFPAQCGLASF
jgi:hypothetical protein